jgi:hypothetical protein
MTFSVTGLLVEPATLLFPTYLAVIVSFPIAAPLELHDAWPEPLSELEHRKEPFEKKSTVPVGVAAGTELVTFEENVTLAPEIDGLGFTDRDVCEDAFATCSVVVPSEVPYVPFPE